MLYLERDRPNLEHTRTYAQKCIHTDYEGEGGTVKKPISYWAFVGKRCVEALCIAKDAGFKRIELEMDGTGDLTPKTTPPQLAELKSAAEEIGIQCCRRPRPLLEAFLSLRRRGRAQARARHRRGSTAPRRWTRTPSTGRPRQRLRGLRAGPADGAAATWLTGRRWKRCAPPSPRE